MATFPIISLWTNSSLWLTQEMVSECLCVYKCMYEQICQLNFKHCNIDVNMGAVCLFLTLVDSLSSSVTSIFEVIFVVIVYHNRIWQATFWQTLLWLKASASSRPWSLLGPTTMSLSAQTRGSRVCLCKRIRRHYHIRC